MERITARRAGWITSTSAGFRATRESLGIEAVELASIWQINPLIVESWEAGLEPIPDNIAWHLATMIVDFQDAIDRRLEVEEACPRKAVVTSQWDGDHQGKGKPMPARWHRAVDLTVANRLARPLVYSDRTSTDRNTKKEGGAA